MTEAQPIYYPVFLDLRGRRCLVVGGGAVARRKVEGLLAAGAAVTVISPEHVPMPEGTQIEARAFRPDDVAGAWLVIASTNDRAVNAAVFHECEARGIWVNVVDVPDESSVIMPAVIRQGALCLAISTGGASPAFARRLREQLETEFGPEYGEVLALLWALRQEWEPRMKAAGLPDPARKAAWEAVLDLPLLAWLREGQRDTADAEARKLLATAVASGA